uniref:Uncharacterized protein n=1 Tax=Anguilla anguilla TaxID=7936 RepID=A0A0E9WPL5_ANGAN
MTRKFQTLKQYWRDQSRYTNQTVQYETLLLIGCAGSTQSTLTFSF